MIFYRVTNSLINAVLFFLLSFFSFQACAQNSATTQEERRLPRYEYQKLQLEMNEVDLLWIGDSITEFWETTGKEVWNEYYGDRKAMNFGISGDRTGHVLWRLHNSPMEKISPKLVIVMIGTNNIWHQKAESSEPFSTPTETAEGIEAIVNKLKKQYPETQILLLEVFPSGEMSNDPHRIAVNMVNDKLKLLYSDDTVKNVRLFDVGKFFLNEDGSIPQQLAPDFIHPSTEGYRIWAKAMEPIVAEYLKKPSKETE